MIEKIIVFDLDDTLYKEIDFLKSAFKEIATTISDRNTELGNSMYSLMMIEYQNGQNAFKKVIEENGIRKFSVEDLIHLYRNHKPNIQLGCETRQVLENLKLMGFPLGIITDGRSIQQRNKLQALGIESWFDHIIISEEFGSEKPDPSNYRYYEKFYKGQFYYIGDNVKKDFISPKILGWTTICLLDEGSNIHPQHFNLSEEYLPDYKIYNINQVMDIIKKS